MSPLDGAACQRAAVIACLLVSSGCIRTAVVGSTCDGGECPELAECTEAKQQLPEGCDRDASTCKGLDVEPDEVACGACYGMIDRLDVGSPIAKCGCTYCAVQLTACFDSASTEDGGLVARERDQLCQAMVECGWAAGCAGSDCYCGEGVDRDTCLKNADEGRLLGACAAVIQSAANCPPGEKAGACVLGRQLMPGSAHDRATEVAKCVSGDPLLQGTVIKPQCR